MWGITLKMLHFEFMVWPIVGGSLFTVLTIFAVFVTQHIFDEDYVMLRRYTCFCWFEFNGLLCNIL